MKIRAIFLLIMIVYDASLHWVEILGKELIHPLYPYFPLFNLISYDIFWTTYWTLAALIMMTLLGSGTTIKTTNETHIHQDKEEIKRLNKKIEELEDEKED